MLTALVLAAVLAVSTAAFAHHGNAAYADNISEFKQAKVTKFAFKPHRQVMTGHKSQTYSILGSPLDCGLFRPLAGLMKQQT